MVDEKPADSARLWRVLGALVVLAVGTLLFVNWWFSSPEESSPSTTVSDESESTTAGETTDHLGVIVDNAPAARPLVGIGDAPILVEYPVEGGITRFVAVVSGGSGGLVGPVRSLRPVIADIVPALSSAVVSSGGQPFVAQEVAAAGITSVTPDIGFGFVSLGRTAPHDTFIDLDQLAEIFAAESGPSGLPAGQIPASETVATEVTLPFAGVGFVYEEGTGYARQQDGSPFVVLDRQGSAEAALAHDTLVVLFAAERSAGYSDSNGTPVSTFDVIGGGDLMVFTGGTVVTGTWSRSALEDDYVFRDGDGGSFGLPEGRVYLAIVPRGAQVTTG